MLAMYREIDGRQVIAIGLEDDEAERILSGDPASIACSDFGLTFRGLADKYLVIEYDCKPSSVKHRVAFRLLADHHFLTAKPSLEVDLVWRGQLFNVMVFWCNNDNVFYRMCASEGIISASEV